MGHHVSRLFLVDGYALIYRAFFAMLSRPLTTSRGEKLPRRVIVSEPLFH